MVIQIRLLIIHYSHNQYWMLHRAQSLRFHKHNIIQTVLLFHHHNQLHRNSSLGNQSWRQTNSLYGTIVVQKKWLPGRTIVGRSGQTIKGNQLIVILREILCCYNKQLPGRTIVGCSKHTKHSPIINTQCIYDYFKTSFIVWNKSSLFHILFVRSWIYFSQLWLSWFFLHHLPQVMTRDHYSTS